MLVDDRTAPEVDLAPEDADRLAAVMQGMASPLRLRILAILRHGPETVTALGERLGASQTSVSNNLRLLRHLELVTGQRDGRNIRYDLFDGHVAALFDEAVRHLGHSERER